MQATLAKASAPGRKTVMPVTDLGGRCCTGRGIQGGIGGGPDARWAIVYAGVPDVDQALSRAGKVGGSRDRARRRQLNRRLVTEDSS